MSYHNPKVSLSETLIFLFTLASGLIAVNYYFAVSAVVAGFMWGVSHVMRVSDSLTQELLLKDATAKYQEMARREFELNEGYRKLEGQVEAMQAQIDALRSANAISFGAKR